MLLGKNFEEQGLACAFFSKGWLRLANSKHILTDVASALKLFSTDFWSKSNSDRTYLLKYCLGEKFALLAQDAR